MTRTITVAPVRKTLQVKASQTRAFDVFTARFGDWWPRTHHIGKAEMKTGVMESHAGGRWYEVGEDGSQCDWGRVLAWEPPQRIVLNWQLNAQWQFDASLHTEVEVRFIAESADVTRVEFEHRLLENMGAQAEQVRTSVDSPGGWSAILANYQTAVGGN